MRPEYKLIMRRGNVKSIQDMIKEAEYYESYERERLLYKPPPNPAQTLVPETAYYSTKNKQVSVEGMRHRQYNPTPRIWTDNGNWGHQQLRQSVRPNLVQTVQYSQAATLQKDQKQYRLGEVKSNSGPGPTVNPPTRNIRREAVPVCWNCVETGHRFNQGGQLRSRYNFPTRPPTGKISCAEELTHYSGSFGLGKLRDCRPYVTVNILGKTFEALIDTGAMPETLELTVCFPEGRQTAETARDPMLEALNEAIDSNYEETESSVTFYFQSASEIKTAVSTSNRTECLSCHEMDKLRKESGPTPNTSYQDVNIQKEASAEDDLEMVNECDVTISRASSPCLSIMEDSEWVDNELGIDFQETSLKTNLNSSTNCITTIRDTPQPTQPPQPEKTEAPKEIKHVRDCSLNVRNVQAASNKQKSIVQKGFGYSIRTALLSE
ncbi:hypothetical protein J6590_103526 [Homalodisca vitripennis]|nr:hypothetical protein J6590_103526 [Homalodisca vitripennis]